MLILSLSLSLLLLFLFPSNAQNTGFMGKRVLINMGAEFSPAWEKPNFFNNPDHYGKWYSFNYTLSPSVECIAWRLGTVGVAYHYFNTKYYYPGEWNGYIDLDEEYNDEEPIADLKAHGFGIFYKQYLGSRAHAPIGPYVKFQFDGFFYKHPYSLDDLSMVKDRIFACKFEFGNDFLFFNMLHLSTAFSLGVPFGGFNTMFYNNRGGFFYTAGDKPIGDYAKGRILGLYWLSFTVNIGLLAF